MYKRQDECIEDWILPDLQKIKWWWQLYGRSDEEMNESMNQDLNKSTTATTFLQDDTITVKDSVKNIGLKIQSFGIDLFSKK